jgi:hypothetical protein
MFPDPAAGGIGQAGFAWVPVKRDNPTASP